VFNYFCYVQCIFLFTIRNVFLFSSVILSPCSFSCLQNITERILINEAIWVEKIREVDGTKSVNSQLFM